MFREGERLTHALTHRSWCAEHPGDPSNERLEFLGDAVLGLVVTDHLFDRYPTLPEGQLAKTRAAVVSSAALAEVGLDLGLGRALRLGKGEDGSGGREKASILADAVEEVVADDPQLSNLTGLLYCQVSEMSMSTVETGDGPATTVTLTINAKARLT